MQGTSEYRPHEEDMEPIESNYECNYNKYIWKGLIIFETYDQKYFNATVLMKQISKKTPAQMLKSEGFNYLKDTDAIWTPPKGTKGVNKYGFGGMYMEWDLFPDVLSYAHPGALMKIAKGIPIVNECPGYLYFCKPDETGGRSCLGTDTIKVGCCWKWERRAGVYGKVKLYRLIKTNDTGIYEKLMLKAVGNILTMDTAHTSSNKKCEYFICPETDTEKWNKIQDVFDIILAITDSENRIEDLKKQKDNEEDEDRINHLDSLITSYEQDIANFKNELENFA